MVFRFINELEMVMEVEREPCCAMSLSEDMIPFYHVSAGAYTAWCGMVLRNSKRIMMAGNEHSFYAGFLTEAQREII